jgi:hypothetical protein
MTARLSTVIERIRTLNAIAAEDHARARLKVDLERLRRRARLLNSGVLAALRGGFVPLFFSLSCLSSDSWG